MARVARAVRAAVAVTMAANEAVAAARVAAMVAVAALEMAGPAAVCCILSSRCNLATCTWWTKKTLGP